MGGLIHGLKPMATIECRYATYLAAAQEVGCNAFRFGDYHRELLRNTPRSGDMKVAVDFSPRRRRRSRPPNSPCVA